MSAASAMDETAERDALLAAMLPDLPFDGWSLATMRAAARRIGMADVERAALFPHGARDAIAWFSHWADRQTLAVLAEKDIAALPMRERIALGVRTRLALLAPHREAVRSALAFLAMPTHLPLGMKLLYDTVDALWYAAGDTATDFNFYTKRGLLAGVQAATTLYWLDDRSVDGADTDAFLARRLADVMAIPRVGRRVQHMLDGLPNPLRLLRAGRRRA